MMSEVPLQAPMVAPPPSESNSRSESRKRERSRSRDRKDKSSKHRHRSRSRSKDRERRKSNRPRSPSPVKWPRRKSLWDVQPTGFDTGQNEDLPQAVNAQQTRQARRIYVGNIPLSVSDIELAEFFNTCLYGAKVTKDQNPSPVTAVQMNREKNFAFLEFACTEDANAAMGFDGINLQGHSLKIRRPKDFKTGMEGDSTDPVASKLSHIISTNVEEGPNKIFAGGLPSYLTEEQVKELVSAFGQLKSFNLVKDSQTGISKGFAFFEYADGDVTDKACAGLNGMKLGEKTILVQRANIGARHVQPVHVSESCVVNKTAFNFLNLQMPIAAAAALLEIDITDPGSPTSIMQLINAVSAPLLESETDFQEILEDIRDECAKYGEIQSMYIPRPPKRHRDVDGNYIPLKEPMWGVGRVFVEYSKPEEAWKAVQALGGRRFSGHIIMAGFFPEDRYIRRDFMPDKDEEVKYFEDFKKRQQEKLLKQEMEQEAQDEDYEYQRRSASRERSRERELKKKEQEENKK